MSRLHGALGRLLPVALATLVAGATTAEAQVALGQVDDFQTSFENWGIGGGPGGVPITPAAVVPSGGPLGLGDAFMNLVSVALGGPGSRLTVSNASQWGGNYLAAGVGAIAMDVLNPGPTDLDLRLVFETLGPGGPTDIAFSDDPIHLPGGSGWTRIVFRITPGDLVSHPALPGSTVLGALTNTTLIRLYHSTADNSPNPFGPIAPVTATLGVDNITALAAIPEPSTVVLVTSGALALVALRRRATRRG